MALRKKPKRLQDTLHYEMLVDVLVGTIRSAFDEGHTASLWGLEGPLRASIRCDLCLQGWRWGDADDLAKNILAVAFRRVGALRPSWNEGQLEWTIEHGSLIERTRCAACHKQLPEGHFKFCSRLCNGRYNQRIAHRRSMTDERVAETVSRWI